MVSRTRVRTPPGTIADVNAGESPRQGPVPKWVADGRVFPGLRVRALPGTIADVNAGESSWQGPGSHSRGCRFVPRPARAQVTSCCCVDLFLLLSRRAHARHAPGSAPRRLSGSCASSARPRRHASQASVSGYSLWQQARRRHHAHREPSTTGRRSQVQAGVAHMVFLTG